MTESPRSASSASIISGLDPARVDTAENLGVFAPEFVADRPRPALAKLNWLLIMARFGDSSGSLVRAVSILRAAELALRSRR
jgi:hypothetical protein